MNRDRVHTTITAAACEVARRARPLVRVAGVALSVAVLASSGLVAHAQTGGQPGSQPNQVIVTLAPGGSIEPIAAEYGAVDVQQAGDSDTYLLTVTKNNTRKLAKKIGLEPGVLAAGPNTIVTSPTSKRAVAGRTMPLTFPGDLASNATLDPSQYDLGAEYIEKLRVTEAVSIARGAGAIVAVIDTGVDLDHPAIKDGLLRDDANSVIGYDFVDNDVLPYDDSLGQPQTENGLGQNDDTAAYGHGTFIAGLILKVAPGAKIMPIRAMTPDGVGTTWSIIQAVKFARDHGANVINMSFGADDKVLEGLDKALQDVREQAVIVAAAGNSNNGSKPQYPSKESFVIAVSALDQTDKKSDFSNFGSHIDIAAPGVHLESAYPGGQYATWSGTSFSTALVSGVAALVVSKSTGVIEPDDAVKAIEDTADESIYTVRGNRNFRGKLGEGRVDPAAALASVPGTGGQGGDDTGGGGGDDDDSGSGGGDDDDDGGSGGDDDDNSGPGGGGDDNSGPGSGSEIRQEITLAASATHPSATGDAERRDEGDRERFKVEVAGLVSGAEYTLRVDGQVVESFTFVSAMLKSGDDDDDDGDEGDGGDGDGGNSGPGGGDDDDDGDGSDGGTDDSPGSFELSYDSQDGPLPDPLDPVMSIGLVEILDAEGNVVLSGSF